MGAGHILDDTHVSFPMFLSACHPLQMIQLPRLCTVFSPQLSAIPPAIMPKNSLLDSKLRYKNCTQDSEDATIKKHIHEMKTQGVTSTAQLLCI
jgi:hypothetical protein